MIKNVQTADMGQPKKAKKLTLGPPIVLSNQLKNKPPIELPITSNTSGQYQATFIK